MPSGLADVNDLRHVVDMDAIHVAGLKQKLTRCDRLRNARS